MKNIAVFDMHTHAYTPEALAFMRNYIKAADLDGISIASFGCDKDGCAAEQNMLPLLFKREEEKIYAFGSLIYPQVPAKELSGMWEPKAQAERLLQMGFDGIKILESKPDSRKRIGLPLSSETYEPFFAYLEEHDVPILWHVADPPAFWDVTKAPDFAVKAGWTYDDSFLSWDETIKEALAVVERHKRLRAVFAHFFFHSDSVDMAQSVLDRHPSVRFDLTPGIEMYQNFSADPAAWRAFFIRNCDRILFGTDADEFCADIMCEDEKSPEQTVRHMRRFLETDDSFRFWGRDVRGVKLPDEVLERIYLKNFRALVPARREVDTRLLAEYAAQYASRIDSDACRAWIARQLGEERK